jgi:hypothetical protein
MVSTAEWRWVNPSLTGLLKIPRKESLKGSTVPGFIPCHFVNRVVDGVQALIFSPLRDVGFAGAGAMFGFDPHLKVLLRAVGYYFAQELCKLGGVFGLLVSGFFPVKADLAIAFAERDPRHGKVHSHLATFAVKVRLQVLYDVGIHPLGYSQNMLGGKTASSFLLAELGSRRLALWAGFGRLVACVNITAN